MMLVTFNGMKREDAIHAFRDLGDLSTGRIDALGVTISMGEQLGGVSISGERDGIVLALAKDFAEALLVVANARK